MNNCAQCTYHFAFNQAAFNALVALPQHHVLNVYQAGLPSQCLPFSDFEQDQRSMAVDGV